jgi:PAS domain S-box-containing protein
MTASFPSPTIGRAETRQGGLTGRSRARILVVDDDPRNLFSMEKVLEDIGEVVCVGSGEEALKLMLQHDFAVVLLDVLMPGMDGYEAAGFIRARERSRSVPIIFLTALSKDDAHMLRGYAMGAVDYVFKPVDPSILRSKVAVFVELFNKTQEIRQNAEQEQRLLEENFRVRTEKFLAEQALRRSEERQAMIIRSLPLVLYAGDFGTELGAPKFISENVAGICGYSAEQFLSGPNLWSSRIHLEDRDRVLREFGRLGETGALAMEYRWRHPDDSYRVFLDQAVLIRDDFGAPKEIFGTLLDVTERRRLEQQLIQSQKLDAIGKLTGGLAHDFNNMLTVVIGSLDRLRQSLDDQKLLRRVDLALEGANRCTDLTRRLLAFARRQSLQSTTVDLNEAIDSLAELANQVIGADIELAIERSDGPCIVQIDPVQVESALLNLMVNARDAMPGGGRLTIRARSAPIEETLAIGEALDAPTGYVAISVTDTGMGIPAEALDRVFEPFFTTKTAGAGTGLGLSIIYGFVKQSGGHIRLESEVGRGTTATIYLPRAPGAEAADKAVEIKAEVPRARAGETVLAVEDDGAVREIAVGMLTDLGYRVLEAPNGPAALQILQTSEAIDLLFTDLAMPGGMSGRELAAEARRLIPGLKVLLTSAHTDQLLADPNPAMPVLHKPYRAQELARAVRVAIDRAPGLDAPVRERLSERAEPH